MENQNFFIQNDQTAALALQLLGAEERAFVRLDKDGRIIALTARAEEILRQTALREIGEVLSGQNANILRRAIAVGVAVCVHEVIDEKPYLMELRVQDGEGLLYILPEQEKSDTMLMQLADQRLRQELSAAELCEGDAKRRAIRRIFRLMRQIELLQGTQPLQMHLGGLGMLCRKTAQAVSERRPDLLITASGNPPLMVFAVQEMCVAAYQLLTNAALAPGVTEIQIRCGVDRDGMAYLEVADNGAPLTSAQFEDLCGRCWRQGDAWAFLRAAPRAGLGLPTICEIAHMHAGIVQLLPEPDGWKAVRLSFPQNLPSEMMTLRAPDILPGYDVEETELSVL